MKYFLVAVLLIIGGCIGGGPRPIDTMAFINFIGNGEDWPADSLQTDVMIKGFQWERYRDALLARGRSASEIIEEVNLQGDGTVRFTGETVLDFLSMFTYVASIHAPPKSVVKAIKAKSRIGTQVGMFLSNYESISQTPGLSSLDAMRTVSRGYRLVGGVNTYGCQYVDVFELSAGTPSCETDGGVAPHTWQIDIRIPNYPAEYISALRSSIDALYDNGDLNFYFYDNVLNRPFFAAATNEPTFPEEEYRQGWKDLLSEHRGTFQGTTRYEAWGNAPFEVTEYSASELKNRFVEHFFRNAAGLPSGPARTLPEIEEAISGAKTNGILIVGGLVSGSDDVNEWATTTKDWTAVKDHIDTIGAADNFTALAARSGTGMFLHSQDEFLAPE